MDKKIALVIMLAVIAIQAIHFGYSWKYINYQNKLDDASGVSYSKATSKTTQGTYAIAFYCVAAAFSALAYGLAIITNLGNIYIHPKLAYHLNVLVFFCQFTLAVIFTTEVSSKVSPSSSNATATEKESNYTDMYWLELADGVITWVLCVPGTFVLAFLNSKEGEAQPVEQKSGTIS